MTKTALRTDADFEAFYRRHWKYVYRLCYVYMKNEADAEDCCEDVFVKVLTGKFDFEDETHEKKWLTVTAGNLCKDRLGSYAHRNVVNIDEQESQIMATTQNGNNQDVLEAVMNLPVKLKDVVLLYYYDGYSTDEIATMLKRPSSTVRNQMKDARSLLKVILGGN